MHALGRYAGASKTLDGDYIVSFNVGKELPVVPEGKELVIDAKVSRQHRSLNANAYLWVLCDKIAQALRTTKEAVYLMQLSRYGVFVDVDIPAEAIHIMQEKFRYTDELENDGENVTIRCYFGSSSYNTEEMSRLIDGTVQDAKDIGVDTWTPEEIDRALALWNGGKKNDS